VVTAHRRRRRQSGQAIVLVAVAMLAMVGVMSLVTSTGALYVERRQVQELADGAALAGAARIPCSGQNAYAAIDGLLSLQLGVSPALSQTPGACASSSASWSRTYPDGTRVTATYPYVDASSIQVWIVSAQVWLPLGGILGASQSTVSARAVAKEIPGTAALSYAAYAQNGITCAGNSPIHIDGSIYSGALIDSNCSLYAHAIPGVDAGNIQVYPPAQKWTKGGGFCNLGVVVGNAICADGYEISASQCPAPDVTDFLVASTQNYPCPSLTVPAPSIGQYLPPEPNADSAALATVGGTACDPNGQASTYSLLYIKSPTIPIGRLRAGQAVVNGVSVSNAPYRDAAGYYHVRPGCYGWLNVSQVQKADPGARSALIFDPGLYYFNGYHQGTDPGVGSAGGLCLSGAQALGSDVEFEFTSSAGSSSFSTSGCDAAPSSSTAASSFGADPASPVIDGGKSYGFLSAPCDPGLSATCPLSAGSSWCVKTDRACSGILIWAPSGPPATTLAAINGTFYVKGTSATGWLYGVIFWPGASGSNPGCQWAANGTSQITGALACLTLQQQGGSISQGVGIFFAQTGAGSVAGKVGLTE
jgi:hypothetical protein